MLKKSIAQLETKTPASKPLSLEARMDALYTSAVKALEGRRWRCELCGQEYGPRWVAWNGRRCDVECDGELVEVRK